jgi:hypothetical protein
MPHATLHRARKIVSYLGGYYFGLEAWPAFRWSKTAGDCKVCTFLVNQRDNHFLGPKSGGCGVYGRIIMALQVIPLALVSRF